MFNFSPPPGPGFRYRPPQDYVPGFNMDENGLPPGDRTWSDGVPPGSAMPQGVTPVKCTTTDGRLDCSSTLGRQFNNIPATDFPGRLEPGVRHYHGYSAPDGPYRESEQTLQQHTVTYPTPGPRSLVKPATPEGTLNEATPENDYNAFMTALAASGIHVPYGTLLSPVKSYLTTDQNGNQVVVNVTEPNHPLHPGYVLRYVTPSENGATIQNEGEGAGGMQGPIGQRIRLPFTNWNLADQLNGVWRGLYGEQTRRGRVRP